MGGAGPAARRETGRALRRPPGPDGPPEALGRPGDGCHRSLRQEALGTPAALQREKQRAKGLTVDEAALVT